MFSEMLTESSVRVVPSFSARSAEAKKPWQWITQKFMLENAKIDPAVTLIASDNWIEFTIRYVVDYKARRSTKDILFTRILEEIEKTQGKVSLASATFQIVGLPNLNVNLGQKG